MRLLRVYAAYQCQVVSLQLIVNSDIRHSGEPSCLSLRKRWIFRRTYPMTLIRSIYSEQPIYFIGTQYKKASIDLVTPTLPIIQIKIIAIRKACTNS